MATFKEYLVTDGYAKFSAARKLETEDSKNDPEDDPFRSRYKARETYGEIRTALKGYINDDAENVTLTRFLAVLDFYLGINFSDTEEIAAGEEHLMNSLQLLEDQRYDREVANVYQTVLNHLSILWSGRRNIDKSMKYLKQAESLYKKFKRDVGNDPHTVEEYFKPDESDQNDIAAISKTRSKHFEDTYTLTLFYIAQVYALTEKKEDSAKYCHVTLQRQLDSFTYKADEWALNAATLSQYYITVDMYHFARHCLASASLIFEEAASKEEDTDEDTKEQMAQKRADIDRCWSKYGLALLEASKDYLMKEVEDAREEVSPDDHNADVKDGASKFSLSDSEAGRSEEENDSSVILDIENCKTFPRFNLEVTNYEEKITDQFVRDFSEAREVFLSVQTRLNDAKRFYVVDGHCSDYIQIIQDISKAYKELAFFELDMDRQCKMHKRRVDMLNDTLTGLNPKYYLLVCRQIMYELAETYSTMVDLKLGIMEAEGRGPNPHSVKKINTLAQQSIAQYNAYLESLKDGKPDFPEEFHENDVRPALVAMFCLGRLYSKIISPEIPYRLALMMKSVECYKFVETYCDKHPDIKGRMVNELGISREMVVLLPLKMEKIRTGDL
ncbi:KIF-binding protein-like [Haliotis rubra]|uniref:KIF-binding protein-like n=1 Tax=Haliotis rubra TaxID=36100 RepID=UPI001EE4F25C|nr:KIF-binding protein-like [Haliotis rubra]